MYNGVFTLFIARNVRKLPRFPEPSSRRTPPPSRADSNGYEDTQLKRIPISLPTLRPKPEMFVSFVRKAFGLVRDRVDLTTEHVQYSDEFTSRSETTKNNHKKCFASSVDQSN